MGDCRPGIIQIIDTAGTVGPLREAGPQLQAEAERMQREAERAQREAEREAAAAASESQP